MKIKLILMLFITVNVTLFAESISVFNIRNDKYPVLSAKFVIYDKNGNLVVPSAIEDLKILEDGIERKILNIKCPEPKLPEPVSILISIDNSGSMNSIDYGITRRIEYGKQTAQNLVSAFANSKSQAAIHTCNTKSFLLQDFTSDKSSLNEAINTIKADGGTDFEEQLLNPKTGALKLVQKGKHKKVVLIFTDACGIKLSKEKMDECLKICKENEITLIAVIFSFNLSMPNGIIVSLNELADSTGGVTFEGVISEEHAFRIAESLQALISNSDLCSVSWTTKECQDIGVLRFVYPKLNLSFAKQDLKIPNNVPGLKIYPGTSLDFGAVNPGETSSIQLTLEAKINDIEVTGIKSDNPAFFISSYDGLPPPFTIKLGDTRTITASFKAVDSNYIVSYLRIEHNGCSGNLISVKGGFDNTFPTNLDLTLLAPNGGEMLKPNTDFQVAWSGTFKGNEVTLSYSTDKGKTYEFIKNFPADGETNYWKVPEKESDSCLMKIKRTIYKTSKSFQTNIQMDVVAAAEWSPDARLILTGNYDNTLILWNATNLRPIKTINDLRIKSIYSASWSPDAKHYVAAGSSPYLMFGDSAGNIEYVDSKHEYTIYSVAWSPDGKYIATASYDRTLKVWDAQKKEVVRDINLKSQGLCLAWGADSKTLAVGTDNNMRLLTFISDTSLTDTSLAGGAYIAVAISPNGKKLFYAHEYGGARLYDLETKKSVFFNFGISRTFAASFSSDSKFLALAQSDYDVILVETAGGNICLKLKGHRSTAIAVSFCPGQMKFVSGSYDRTAIVWTFDKMEKEDVSDSVWSIIIPRAESKDLAIGKVLVGSSKDSVFSDFVVNTGRCDIRIDSVKFPRASNFKIVSGSGPYILKPGESMSVEIRFAPKVKGDDKSEINIHTLKDTIKLDISGSGISPLFKLSTSFIDFGKVLVNNSKSITKKVLKIAGDSALDVTGTEIVNFINEPYSLVKGGGNFKLSKKIPEREVTVDFTPTKAGRISGEIIFHFKDGESAKIQLYGEGIPPCDSGGFVKMDFYNIPDFNLVGDAKLVNDMIRLTPADFGKSGAVWNKNFLYLEKGFTSEFTIRLSGGRNNKISDGSVQGADGFAFVVQNWHPYAIGHSGGGLGYQGIYNSVAIEFDLFSNDSTQIVDLKDPNGNHLSVQTNYLLPNTAKHNDTNTIASCSDCLPLFKSDSTTQYFVKIEYEPKRKSLLIFCDTTGDFRKPVLSLDESSGKYFLFSRTINLFQGTSALVGITSATGSAYQRHDLLSWTFCNPVPPMINDVENNCIDTQSDLLSIVPNPFSDEAEIRLNIDVDCHVKLKIVNLLGENVMDVADTRISAGIHRFSVASSNLADGVYYCILETKSGRVIKELFKIH